jgi:hypothetical protein
MVLVNAYPFTKENRTSTGKGYKGSSPNKAYLDFVFPLWTYTIFQSYSRSIVYN